MLKKVGNVCITKKIGKMLKKFINMSISKKKRCSEKLLIYVHYKKGKCSEKLEIFSWLLVMCRVDEDMKLKEPPDCKSIHN